MAAARWRSAAASALLLIPVLSGWIAHEAIYSALLRGNPLGDPHASPVGLYTPPEYNEPGDTCRPTSVKVG